VTGASQTTMLIALGRVFDQGPDARCTLDRLIRIAQAGNGDIFAAHRPADRKRRASPNADEWLGDHLSRI
jgi:hypothetical protein